MDKMIRIISGILLLAFTRAEDARESVDEFVDHVAANLVDDLYDAFGADLDDTTLGQPDYLARRFRTDSLFSRSDISSVVHLGPRQTRECGIACAKERDGAQPQHETVQAYPNRRHAFASVASVMGAMGVHGTALAYGEERLAPATTTIKTTTAKPPPKAKATKAPAPTKPPPKAKAPSTTKPPPTKPPPKAKPAATPAAAKTPAPAPAKTSAKTPAPAPAKQKPKQAPAPAKPKAKPATTTPEPPQTDPGYKLGAKVGTGNDFVQFKDVSIGKGKPVSNGAEVTIKYRIDGRPLPFFQPVFRETKVVKAGKGELLKGLDSALLGSGKGMPAMKEGGDRTVILPAEVAFGKKGSKEFNIKPNAIVELKVEVVSVKAGGPGGFFR